jgi:hypothetical protein
MGYVARDLVALHWAMGIMANAVQKGQPSEKKDTELMQMIYVT